MAGQGTIEQRISRCEEEIAQLKGEWQGIPDLIEARLRLTDSRVARLQSESSDMKRELADLKHRIEVLPRVLAEMLDERERRKR